MSQNFTSLQKEVSVSTSMLTFKDYHMRFIGIKDPHLANGWGWFVDIELNSEPIRMIEPSYHYTPSQYVTLPKTIKEYPSIRSMKSMKNLHDTSMLFEIDNDDVKHRTNNCSYGYIITHTFELIVIIIYYFMICSTKTS